MIGVLVSGEGTNLQALIDAGLPIVAVASNRPGVRALARAEQAGIPTAIFDADDYATARSATSRWPSGSRSRASSWSSAPATCTSYAGRSSTASAAASSTRTRRRCRVPRRAPVEDVLAAGRAETAATIHYVDEGIDTGPVIAAERVPVRPTTPSRRCAQRVQAVEHRLLPEVVRELCGL